MSNQVYSNDSQRYVGQKGICKFAATNAVGVIANGTAVPIVFNDTPAVSNQNMSYLVLNQPDGLVEVQQEGIYTVNVEIKLSAASGTRFSFDAYIELRSLSGVATILKLAEAFKSDGLATASQLVDSVSLSATIYLPAGSEFWSVVTSRNSTNDLSFASANMTIIKIA